MKPEEYQTTMFAGLAHGEPIPERFAATVPFLDDAGIPYSPVHAVAQVLAVEGKLTTPMHEAQRMIRVGGIAKERARQWLRDELHWRLRGSDKERVRRIARGGGPTRVGDLFHIYCPVCGCRKSGDLDIPNGRDSDVCDDSNCPCHEEDE